MGPVDTRHWIGGKRIASPATFPDISPIDGTVLAEIAHGGAIEVDARRRRRPGRVSLLGRHIPGRAGAGAQRCRAARRRAR